MPVFWKIRLEGSREVVEDEVEFSLGGLRVGDVIMGGKKD